ncbi:MAG: SAM-dependent methyltransferase [Candidatus Calescibacterium sp.]|nr:SAM-dependent methyltransferase [Candidatus Calescibacterium sp.]MCX7733537.1 SAM-dependent methyltransferase [bacterium]MDW8087250.1 SAM-dependent methyltransferase [Candidatus Calescibacterium sp.]
MKFSDFLSGWILKFYSENEARENFLTLPQKSEIFGMAILSKIKKIIQNTKQNKKSKEKEIKREKKEEREKKSISILEIGAGDGDLSYSLIKNSENFGINIEKLILVEFSERRIENIKAKFENHLEPIFIKSLFDFNGKVDFIISNEFFDSLPFSVIIFEKGIFKELFVENGKPYFAPATESSLEYIRKYIRNEWWPSEQQEENKIVFEICELFPNYIKKISETSNFTIISDYGYRYFYHRTPFGSATLHWKHRAEKINFFEIEKLEKQINHDFGKKDISFFVDFDILEKIFTEYGYKVYVQRLSSFIIENLEDYEFSEEESRKNALDLIEALAGWGNFFVLNALNE